MELTRWKDRKFDFNFPAGLFPVILERLRGTAARIDSMCKGLNKGILTKRAGTSWSIQEHAGHLLDLEELHEKRLNQFISGMEILIPADMANKKTYLANHNSKDFKDILSKFKESRAILVGKAENLDDITIMRTAMHPRLNKEMRLVDMLYFTAEHDDHHLAVMRNLINKFI